MPAILAPIFRWAARISGLLIVLVFCLLFVGEYLRVESPPPAGFREWAGILLLVACCAGMILAWHHELLGALVSLAALNALAFIVRFWQYTILFIVAIPSFFYLADWLIEHNARSAASRLSERQA